jgi:PAS domain S-box-containing protein
MKASILVVDDEESIRFTMKRFLSKEGHGVLTVADYPAALRMISSHEPDLIFADIVLGDRSGIDILNVVRDRGFRCPVIMITGFPNLKTASEAMRRGAFDYLAKPVRKEQILRAAFMALNHKKALDERAVAETRQENYRRHLEAVFRSVSDAIVTVNADMIVTGANESVRHVCGLDPAEVIGETFESSFHFCDRACEHAIRRILKDKAGVEDQNILCRHQHRPNQVVALNGTKLVDAHDNFLGAVLVLKDRTRLAELERKLGERGKFHNIVGKSKKMQEIYRLVEDLSDVETTVLIQGESGTGKELIAEALHYNGNRAGRQIIKVNCAALTESILESELFGHVKGAFTGAVKDRIGRFQMAQGGSIFLDEIGDMPLSTQVKLLRVLEEKVFEPVGDSRPVKVDIRVIASTNSVLMEKVKNGEFRKDLYYRLKVLEITLPPLRERRPDIPLLVAHFCNRFKRQLGKSIEGVSDEALQKLMAYSWPGNVRELKHAMEHAFIVCHDNWISLDHLPPEIVNHTRLPFQSGAGTSVIHPRDISEAIHESQGNISEAARRLGISRQTIYRKIKKT